MFKTIIVLFLLICSYEAHDKFENTTELTRGSSGLPDNKLVESKHHHHHLKTSWWQSPIIVQDIQRRVTGNPNMTFAMFFKNEMVMKRRRGKAFKAGLSLGSGRGQFEHELVRIGVVRNMLGVDISETRVKEASSMISNPLKDKLKYEVHDLEVWQPEETSKFDLIVLKMAFHHIERIEFFIQLFKKILTEDGVIYFDEYVGPRRFQFAENDIKYCNDLLSEMPEELTKDVNGRVHRVMRPNLEKFIKLDPSEAVRSDELIGLLSAKFEMIGNYPYGGNIFGWLFSRILFRFNDYPDIIRRVLETEEALLREKKLSSHYVLAFFARTKETSGMPSFI